MTTLYQFFANLVVFSFYVKVWNWFQNRRYAIRAKAARAPGSSTVAPPMPRDESATVISVPQAAQPPPAPSGLIDLGS